MAEAFITRRGGGVKFASGTTTVTPTTSTVTWWSVTVSGIDFKPKMICFKAQQGYAGRSCAWIVQVGDAVKSTTYASNGELKENTFSINNDGFTAEFYTSGTRNMPFDIYWYAIGY